MTNQSNAVQGTGIAAGRRHFARGRTVLAVGAGKLAGKLSRALGRGGGTALPGLVSTGLEPALIQRLSSGLACGSVLISGTNGKTTTSRMLDAILRRAGYQTVRNTSGSNLSRGLATTLVQHSSWRGDLGAGDRSIGVFEVDEAALPHVAADVPATAVLLLDLFRDQLDRYGEVATVAAIWVRAVDALPPDTWLVLNADDPLVASVAQESGRSAVFFGVDTGDHGAATTGHGHDVKSCPRCGHAIQYASVAYGHLGAYSCPSCGFSRPAPEVSARDIAQRGDATKFTLVTPRGMSTVELAVPGLYNVYNALGASAVALQLGIAVGDIAAALSGVTPAFGRMEATEVEGRRVVLALAKNPTGLNEVLRAITHDRTQLCLLVMLNDNTADGRDVSWIWDADVEQLAGRVASAVFSGTRAEDMALRFKYARLIGNDEAPRWALERDIPRAFRAALDLTPAGSTLTIVPTYTALLEIHRFLSRQGYLRPYWEQ